MTGNLFIFSGAGLSAESGIPTFRDKSGLWEEHDLDVVCNHLTWKDNRHAVHDFYNDRRMSLARARPNEAHVACAEWQKKYNATVFTQNIDDLLEQAGCKNVIHLHGLATEMLCEKCDRLWSIGNTKWSVYSSCPYCGQYEDVKPGVVFFNEVSPNYKLLYQSLNKLTSDDIALVIGTSAQVINIGAMLEQTDCFKILNNLAPANDPYYSDLENRVYDQCYFKPASQAIDQISQLLETRLICISE